MIFYAAFIPGLQKLIAEVIKERLSDAKIHRLLDGAVVFETGTSYDKLNFFCFNNIFAVIDIMENAESSTATEKHIKTFVSGNSGNVEIISNNSKNFKSFRIVVSNENKPAAVGEKLRAPAEKYIARLSGLKPNRSKPDTEFWFLSRSEGFSVFMKRLTARPAWEKTLHKGELPPPMAWSLCRLANLSHGDTVLDPFCGYGSIPSAALKHFHITKFIACDNDKKTSAFSAARFKKIKNEGFILYQVDFSELPSLIGQNSVDAIVTDPPWGHFKEIEDGFYQKMFGVFDKLLKSGGRAVTLCANKDEVLKASGARFNLQSDIPILLSGKKTEIFVFVKK